MSVIWIPGRDVPCGVCYGRGRVPAGNSTTMSVECRACNGHGYGNPRP